jgi:hypothetical protein
VLAELLGIEGWRCKFAGYEMHFGVRDWMRESLQQCLDDENPAHMTLLYDYQEPCL